MHLARALFAALDFEGEAELHAKAACDFLFQRLPGAGENVHLHQVMDDLVRLEAELGGEVLDDDGGLITTSLAWSCEAASAGSSASGSDAASAGLASTGAAAAASAASAASAGVGTAGAVWFSTNRRSEAVNTSRGALTGAGAASTSGAAAASIGASTTFFFAGALAAGAFLTFDSAEESADAALAGALRGGRGVAAAVVAFSSLDITVKIISPGV